MLAGLDIQMEQAKPYSMSFTSVREAHGFAQAGGVMGAVKAYLKEEADKINAVQVANLDKKLSVRCVLTPSRARLRGNLLK